MPDIDWDKLSLQEFIQLQAEVASQLRRRFERKLALAFTDIVGSTAYFESKGDIAGKRLMQRHHVLVDGALGPRGGRVVDTAGDGAFCVFDTAELAALSLINLQEKIIEDNVDHPPDERLTVRCGMHWGGVLLDDISVSGDAVNTCARVASSASGGEIRLTESAFQQLPPSLRVRCQPGKSINGKGLTAAVRIHLLHWQDPSQVPTAIHIEEGNERIDLPSQQFFSMGRLALHQGKRANAILLKHPDPELTKRISRWHLKFERTINGLTLSPVSRGPTKVDGRAIHIGDEVRVEIGTVVQVGKVLTLRFVGTESEDAFSNTDMDFSMEDSDGNIPAVVLRKPDDSTDPLI
ncbi:MAG: adenylate/guanylate cyclase domain-containing protein [Fuerstiella sp.]|nr:adenylate/guanylate cyclase domain-containing protein [Fuerstiella sp.]